MSDGKSIDDHMNEGIASCVAAAQPAWGEAANRRIIDIWSQANPGEVVGITIGADESLVTVGDRISETVRLDGSADLSP